MGVVQGIVEILGLTEDDRSPFDIYSGTSVGSINAMYFASNAHRGDLGVGRVRRLWTELGVNSHLQMEADRAKLNGLTGRWFSRALLNSKPLQRLVRDNLSFDDLHKNVDAGLVKAAMVAAFDLGTSQTTIFSETHPSVEMRPTRDPTRIEWHGRLRPEHIQASSAIPFIFPVQQIGGHFYCDGGVRFNTPISPAIRAGANRFVVISLKYDREDPIHESHLHQYPTVPFLAGRLLGALLLDPFEYDLDVLERFNRLTAALEEALPPEELERVYEVLRETRGAPYRKLDKLVFSPTKDVGRLANEHLREHLASYKIGALPRYFLKKAAIPEATWEADWATYLLFDGGYAEKLIELGVHDAYARRERILEFFGMSAASPAGEPKQS